MNSSNYLYAAYAATWLIHGFYISALLRRYFRLRGRFSGQTKR